MNATQSAMGLFDKLKQGLKKTTQLLNTDVRDLFKSEGRLVDDAFLDELSGVLIKTDMGVPATEAIVDERAHRVPRSRGANGRGAGEPSRPSSRSCWPSPPSRSASPPRGRR